MAQPFDQESSAGRASGDANSATSPLERLAEIAARTADGWRLYEVDDVPSARRGEDVGDFGRQLDDHQISAIGADPFYVFPGTNQKQRVADRKPFEVTTLRRDVENFGRKARVEFTDDWHTDAARRDFTRRR